MELQIFKVQKTSPKNRVDYFWGTEDHLDPSQTRGTKWNPEFLHSHLHASTPYHRWLAKLHSVKHVCFTSPLQSLPITYFILHVSYRRKRYMSKMLIPTVRVIVALFYFLIGPLGNWKFSFSLAWMSIFTEPKAKK